MQPAIEIKRAYDPVARGDGLRVLVDRLWPRGVKKENLKLNAWAKDLAPSTQLRQWFAHDPEKWSEFRKRYRAELSATGARDAIAGLLAQAKGKKTITLIYAAKDTRHNEAVVLRNLFERAADSATA
ncbi:MAG TPA: DUF488 domain-containing protein [Candidatus Cybelea sp.]|jgi:uncharacterized protein YeaO (DUF488 family)|nr:DUF488 domain-containing protein [Candidatus Cybelea sp.]